MKYYALSRHDGGVEIMQVVSGSVGEAIIKWPASRQAEVKSARQLTDAEFAAIGNMDRTFRDAWKDNGSGIDHDIGKARDIHMTRIRRARDQELAALDAPWLRATGQGKADKAAQIEAQKQTLRDIPQTLVLERAATPEELKQLWPDELK